MTHPIPDRAHLLTIDDACEALGIGRSKTYELITSGALKSLKIGSRRLVAVSSIAEYIRHQLTTEEDAYPLTRKLIDDLIEAGELRSLTLGDHVFVSVDSLDTYARNHGEAAS